MLEASIEIQEVPAWLDEVASRDTSSSHAASAPPLAATLDEVVRRCASPAWPEDLVARPCPAPAAEWHRERLIETLAREDGGPVARARAAYHARWLAHLICPDDAHLRPRVSIVIPLYDRAHLIAEAVRSCLADAHAPHEIIVVDDGSTDHPEEALRGVAGPVRLVRQENGGVSSARNHGLRVARGDLIQFLDSDDVLAPRSVGKKFAALRAVPDAELCFSPSIEVVRGRPDLPDRPPDGGERCATRSLLGAAARGFPFFVGAALIARWVLLEIGGFDEGLRRIEDDRLCFQLGLRGAKAIGLREPLLIRRRFSDSLSRQRRGRDFPGATFAMLGVLDLLGAPSQWAHLEPLLERLTWYLCRDAGDATGPAEPGGRFQVALDQLILAIRAIGDGRARGGLSPLPALDLISAMLRRLRASLLRESRHPREVARRLGAAVRAALAGAAPLGPADLDFWVGTGRAQAILALARRGARAGAPALTLSSCERILRGERIPTRSRAALLATLAPRLGARRARAAIAALGPLIDCAEGARLFAAAMWRSWTWVRPGSLPAFSPGVNQPLARGATIPP